MPQAPRYRGACALGPQLVTSPAGRGLGRGRSAGGRAGARDSPCAPPEPAPAGRPDAGAAHLHLQDRERQGDSDAGFAGAAGRRARSGCEPAGARLRAAVATKKSRRFWPIRSWPRLPRCCRIWTRCSARCFTGRCATWPRAGAAPPRVICSAGRSQQPAWLSRLTSHRAALRGRWLRRLTRV